MSATSLAAPARPVPISRAKAALALALLLGLQPVTTDVFLPALPQLTRALGASMSQAQLTMSALILAFGIAQLVWGPIADRIGRRPVLIAGLTLYAVASVGSTLAPGIEWLIGWRMLQGATLAAAVVCARALVRDLYEPVEGAQVMSLGLSGLAVIALLGPLIGGAFTWWLGWRSALGLVAACGALTLAWVAWALPETVPRRNPEATRPGPLFAQWRRIARDPVFRAWTMLITASYGGLFVILAGSSFVFIESVGLSPSAYGLAMASGSVAYMAGTFACRRWVSRHGMAGAVKRGAGFTLAAAITMVGLAAAGVHTAWALLLPQWLYCFGHGVHQPCGQTGAVSPFPQAAGAASALAGFVLAAVAFVVGLWLGRVLASGVMAYAASFGFWAAVTATVAWTAVQRAAR